MARDLSLCLERDGLSHCHCIGLGRSVLEFDGSPEAVLAEEIP